MLRISPFASLFFLHSSILSPSPLMTCQVRSWPPRGPVHRMRKFADHSGHLWLCPVPFFHSLHFPCRKGRLGAKEGVSDTAQDCQNLNLDPELSFPGLHAFPGPTSPWAWGASHPRTVMDSLGTFKGLCICLQCRP